HFRRARRTRDPGRLAARARQRAYDVERRGPAQAAAAQLLRRLPRPRRTGGAVGPVWELPCQRLVTRPDAQLHCAVPASEGRLLGGDTPRSDGHRARQDRAPPRLRLGGHSTNAPSERASWTAPARSSCAPAIRAAARSTRSRNASRRSAPESVAL